MEIFSTVNCIQCVSRPMIKKKKCVSRPKRLDLKIRQETRICVLSHDDSSPTTLYAIDSDLHSESSFLWKQNVAKNTVVISAAMVFY